MKKPHHLLHRLFVAARAAPEATSATDVEPPPGFAARVLQQRRGHPDASGGPSFAILLRNLSLGAAAVVLCLALGIGFFVHPTAADTADENLAVQSQIESWVTLL